MYTAIFAALLGASFVLAAPKRNMHVKNKNVLQSSNSSSCVFSGTGGYLDAKSKKASCSTIVLSSLTVPGGVTLDLETLNDGTTVIFEGTTTWEFSEWDGPLFSVSGNNITVKGAPGSVLDGQGALWWDGQGNGGGKTKPKFFKANNCKKLPNFPVRRESGRNSSRSSVLLTT